MLKLCCKTYFHYIKTIVYLWRIKSNAFPVPVTHNYIYYILYILHDPICTRVFDTFFWIVFGMAE